MRCPDELTVHSLLHSIDDNMCELLHNSRQYTLELMVDKDELYTAMKLIADLVDRVAVEEGKRSAL